MKKILALLLAIMMILAMGTVAFASGDTGEGGEGGEGATGSMSFTYTGADATTNGNISLSNATQGTTYTLYKIFDATYDSTDATKVSCTIKDGALKTALTSSGADYFVFSATADGNGNFSVSRKMQEAPNQDKPVKSDAELLTYLKGLNTSLFTEMGEIKASGNGKIDFEKVPYGYYMIVPDKPSPGAVVTIDTNNPTVTVIDKNNKPEFDKNIVLEGDEEILSKWSESGMAIPVPFQIDLVAQNYDGEEKIFKYRISDTLDAGFTLTQLPTVTVNGEEPEEYTITYKTAADGDAVTVNAIADALTVQYFEIDIPWTDDGTVEGEHLYDPNAEVQVTYEAILDPAKAEQIKVGATANDNTADVKYWKGTDTPDKPKGDLPDRKTKSWETSLTIQKTDEKGKELTGAEFTLTTENGTKVSYVYIEEYVVDNENGTHWKLNDGTYTTEAPTGEPTHDAEYDDTETKYSLQKTGTVLGEGQTAGTSIVGVVGEDGKVTFSGLGTGKYKLVETKVPEGFNKAEDIEFTISFRLASDADPADPKDSDGIFDCDNEAIVLRGTSNVFDTTIVNKSGVELPSTGGIGTTIFYVAGSILVLAAVVLLVTKRRMSAGE